MQTALPASRRTKRGIAALLVVVAAADFLLFEQAPGLNLFLLAILSVCALLFASPRPARPLRLIVLFSGSVLAAAPLLEAPTLSGMIIATIGVALVALARVGLVPMRLSAVPAVLLRFMPAMVTRLAGSGRRYLRLRSSGNILAAISAYAAGWMLPVIMGLVFLLLFSAANPLVERVLYRIDLGFLLQLADIRRILLWLFVASAFWAMIRPRLSRRSKAHPVAARTSAGWVGGGLGKPVLVRCLWLFNLLFAMQTLLDVVYLWGGAELPAGMSHAQYAHRGAYPLVATALLSAAFVLVSMRRGGSGDESRVIRALVIAWILQNVLLCLSAILRLDLYVQAYSLTGWRVAALIWMGLVAVGLCFILARIVLQRSNEWLVAMNLATLATALYVVSVVDVSGFIARFNVQNSAELGQSGAPLDIAYLASLGPSAMPALDQFLASVPADETKARVATIKRRWLESRFLAKSDDWRSWTYRSHRMKTYLRSSSLIER